MSSWWERAECRDMSLQLFFPFPGDEKTRDEALAVCAVCPVTAQCHEFAVDRRTESGVWGGEDFSVKRVRRVQAEAVAS